LASPSSLARTPPLVAWPLVGIWRRFVLALVTVLRPVHLGLLLKRFDFTLAENARA
jgi:hypothetical protein